MKRIAPIRLRFALVTSEEGERKVRIAYARIFETAWGQMALDLKSTPEYIGLDDEIGGFSDTGGGGEEIKGEENYGLPNVSGGEDSGSEVWESLADQRRVTCEVAPRRGD